MTRASHNYLEELAGVQAQAPSSLDISEEPAGELVQPQSNQPPSESCSPELQAYIRQCVLDTVAHAMTTTVIPEVVESTLARVKAERVSTPAATSPPSVVQQSQAEATYYETPVPMLHTTTQPYRRHMMADIVCWGAVTVIIGMLGGLAFYTIRQSPQTQTVHQNQQLNQSNQALSERLVESNAQVLESKQRCGNFSLICNIKE